jgi:hypothetical protein
VEGWAGTYLSALVQQRLCKGSAYALRGAGHQRHFAVHVHGALLLGARWASPRLCGRGFYGPCARACGPVGGDAAVRPVTVSPAPEL